MQIETTGLLSAGRRLIAGLAIAGLLGAGLTGAVAAQEETAAAGNGGTVTTDANGGAVSVGDGDSGGNTGSTVSGGDSSGGQIVVGGDVTLDAGASAEEIIAAVYESLGLAPPE
jgi:hypothetical protein